MHILVTNDDGYLSPGLASLAIAMQEFGTVSVVAPQVDMSGSGSCITLDKPLRVGKAESGFFFVNGTPVDCVHLAITALFKDKPDIVVSGINNGKNIAQDVHYSGTVSAAMEGYMHGIPSIAFSLDSNKFNNLPTALHVVKTVVRGLIKQPFSNIPFLNVNIPNVELKNFCGLSESKLGKRAPAFPAISIKSPKGEKVYWVGAAGEVSNVLPGTDFHALVNNFASITPLTTDMSKESSLEELEFWIEKIS